MTWLTKIVDLIFAAGLFINAALFVPQLIRILKKKHAKDISLITFIGFNIIQIAGTFYGYIHNDLIIMWGFALTFITCGTVTVMTTYYRYRKSTTKSL